MSAQIKKILDLCYEAIEMLGISEGEFWVWYGNPLLLPSKTRK